MKTVILNNLSLYYSLCVYYTQTFNLQGSMIYKSQFMSVCIITLEPFTSKGSMLYKSKFLSVYITLKPLTCKVLSYDL